MPGGYGRWEFILPSVGAGVSEGKGRLTRVHGIAWPCAVVHGWDSLCD